MSIPLPLPSLALHGRLVDLEPLSHDHIPGLQDAVADGDLWSTWYTSVPRPEEMAAEIDRRLALREQGSMLPFTTIRRSDGLVLGMTTFMNIDPSVPRVEIGSTWNRASVHGTGTNPDSKLLLLAHAFEQLGVGRVALRCDHRNARSHAAIARLGARFEGTLRAFRPAADGTVADVDYFSVLSSEWPEVRSGLLDRLTSGASCPS